jgi:hypothetical protein
MHVERKESTNSGVRRRLHNSHPTHARLEGGPNG